MTIVAQSEKALVAKAKHLQATGNVTSWELADVYASLKHAGWTVRKIADECESNRETVRRFCVIVTHYCVKNERPSFWQAFQDVDKKTKAAIAARQIESRAASVANVAITPEVRHGDFREVLSDIPDESVDLIFTDPPYSRTALDLFADLGKFAARVLTKGGNLITYFGQALLPEVVGHLVDSGLIYRWLICVRHEVGPARMTMPKVAVHQKPLLWFSKGVPFQSEFVADLIHSKRPDKKEHDWQQSSVEAEYLIERLSPKGGMVIDPFAGSGTTLIVAKKLGRAYVGAEIDETHCKTTSKRLTSCK